MAIRPTWSQTDVRHGHACREFIQVFDPSPDSTIPVLNRAGIHAAPEIPRVDRALCYR